MALEVNYKHDGSGATYSSAYARVNAVTLDCVGDIATVHIAVYASKQTSDEGKTPVLVDNFIARDRLAVTQVEGEETIEVEPAVTDFTDFFCDSVLKAKDVSVVANAYAFLKTFAIFKDAKDV